MAEMFTVSTLPRSSFSRPCIIGGSPQVSDTHPSIHSRVSVISSRLFSSMGVVACQACSFHVFFELLLSTFAESSNGRSIVMAISKT